MINTTARTYHAEPTEEAFPSRGRVGMFCLIATEATQSRGGLSLLHRQKLRVLSCASARDTNTAYDLPPRQ